MNLFRKSRVLSLVLVISAILLLWTTLLGPKTCKAFTISWQDDFNDGNYDDWTVNLGSTFSAANNYLEATTENAWNWVSHPSDVAYGSWQFDVYAVDTPANHCYVYIISSGSNYRLCVWTGSWAGAIPIPGPGFTLIKEYGGVSAIADYYPGTPIAGWVTINVTRTEAGEFSFYIDGVLRMQVTDNDLTISSTFRFAGQGGWRIDNIVVSDFTAPTTTTTTPPPIPGFPFLAILLAVPLALTFGLMTRRRKEH